MTYLYVPAVMRPWSAVGLEPTEGALPFPVELRVDPDDPCIGFLPVFTTREAAVEFCDGDKSIPIITIQRMEHAPAEPGAATEADTLA